MGNMRSEFTKVSHLHFNSLGEIPKSLARMASPSQSFVKNKPFHLRQLIHSTSHFISPTFAAQDLVSFKYHGPGIVLFLVTAISFFLILLLSLICPHAHHATPHTLLDGGLPPPWLINVRPRIPRSQPQSSWPNDLLVRARGMLF